MTNNLSLEKYSFIRLNHDMQGVAFYELQNNTQVTGEPDFTRINVYLTKDGSYITVWSGLLEPMFAESALEGINIPKNFDFSEQYDSTLFRGYIDTDEELEVILRTIRIESFRPQVLMGDKNNMLSCQLIE